MTTIFTMRYPNSHFIIMTLRSSLLIVVFLIGILCGVYFGNEFKEHYTFKHLFEEGSSLENQSIDERLNKDSETLAKPVNLEDDSFTHKGKFYW